MTLVRFDPFAEFDRWAEAALPKAWRPDWLPFDAYRRDNEVVLHFDLPGVDEDSIEVTVERGVLTVAGERKGLQREGDEVLVARRPVGHFSRQFTLGEGLNLDGVAAEYEAGVLTVHLPVAEHVQPRRIEVRSSAPRALAAEAETASEGAAA